jgi:hypothetical protein
MADVADAPAQSREAYLRVLRGKPTDEELAALLAVLALLGSRSPVAHDGPHAARLRRRHRTPGSWRIRR